MNLFRKPSLSRARIEELKYEAMLVRNERRLAEARASLKQRGIAPIAIGTGHVPSSVARTYTHMNVRASDEIYPPHQQPERAPSR